MTTGKVIEETLFDLVNDFRKGTKSIESFLSRNKVKITSLKRDQRARNSAKYLLRATYAEHLPLLGQLDYDFNPKGDRISLSLRTHGTTKGVYWRMHRSDCLRLYWDRQKGLRVEDKLFKEFLETVGKKKTKVAPLKGAKVVK